MATIKEALAVAAQHHQAGRLQIAEQIYRQILAVDPNHAGALHLLGVVAFQLGDNAAAVKHISRAIELNGTQPAFHSNLGNAFKAQGKLDEAVAAFRRALELKPAYAVAHSNLGTVLQAQGELDDAITCFRKSLEIDPSNAEACNNLGTALQQQWKLDEAIDCFSRAIALKPDYAVAHSNLGTAFQDQKRLDHAVSSFRMAVHFNPDFAEAHYNLGTALQSQGKLDEAVASYRRAIELEPNNAETHYNLGTTFQAQSRLDDAVASYRRVLELKPDHTEAHNNLGTALDDQGQLDDAIACFHRVLELQPDHAEAHNNLANAFQAHGKIDDAVASYRRALEREPNYAYVFSNLLGTIQYRSGVNLSELATTHAEFDRLFAAPLRASWQPHDNDRDHHRRLRVGFVSPNFGWHPVGFFLIQALENLDRNQCEIVCYCDRIIKDEYASRFEAAATVWQIVSHLTDQELAAQIRADRIDILFDLAGHTIKNRLLVFARKPAPIQVTWADYVGTTGLTAMDYILADRYEIPVEAEPHYRERVLRMPDDYICYEPPSYAPPVSPLHALTTGYVTFGSFNNRAKITPQTIEVWAKILHRLPHSRLLLKYRQMNFPSIAKGLAEQFASHGIDPARIEYQGFSPHSELLAEYNRVDLALDTFPYNGGLTTCEALWMGVPVITCPGETFASRHSLSHSTNAGLTETIAHDLDEYVELAVSLATDLPRLASLRATLRERMAASPLCDGKRFAENLLRVLREIWRDWCANPAATEPDIS